MAVLQQEAEELESAVTHMLRMAEYADPRKHHHQLQQQEGLDGPSGSAAPAPALTAALSPYLESELASLGAVAQAVLLERMGRVAALLENPAGPLAAMVAWLRVSAHDAGDSVGGGGGSGGGGGGGGS